MDFIKNIKREHLILIGVLVIIIVIILTSVLGNGDDTIIFNPEPVIEEVDEEYFVYIDIKGEVNNPGVYKVNSDYRLFQVVNLAGGLTTSADTLAVNLSQKIRDGLAIYIPSVDDEYEKVVVTDVNEGMININQASQSALESLPGIGPSTALAIIEYRAENVFMVIEDIMDVPGIGEATFNDIKDSIIV